MFKFGFLRAISYPVHGGRTTKIKNSFPKFFFPRDSLIFRSLALRITSGKSTQHPKGWQSSDRDPRQPTLTRCRFPPSAWAERCHPGLWTPGQRWHPGRGWPGPSGLPAWHPCLMTGSAHEAAGRFEPHRGRNRGKNVQPREPPWQKPAVFPCSNRDVKAGHTRCQAQDRQASQEQVSNPSGPQPPLPRGTCSKLCVCKKGIQDFTAYSVWSQSDPQLSSFHFLHFVSDEFKVYNNYV